MVGATVGVIGCCTSTGYQLLPSLQRSGARRAWSKEQLEHDCSRPDFAGGSPPLLTCIPERHTRATDAIVSMGPCHSHRSVVTQWTASADFIDHVPTTSLAHDHRQRRCLVRESSSRVVKSFRNPLSVKAALSKSEVEISDQMSPSHTCKAISLQ